MIYKSSCAYSFGKSDKKTDSSFINKSIKNPDIYKYKGEVITKPTKGFTFSKEEKFKTFRPITPAPDKYKTDETTLGKGVPKYSMYKSDKETEMSQIIRRNKKNNIPGPTDYTITEENCEKTIFNKTISNHFSKEPKLKLYDNKVPGVWKYSTASTEDFGKGNKNKFSMTKTVRNDIVDKSKISSSAKNKGDITALEPGKYDISSSFGKEGIKPLLRGKPKDIKPFNTPGPDKYDAGQAKIKTLRKNPTTCMGFGNRTDITAKEKKKNVPGFKYDIKSEFDITDKKNIKGNTFSKSERMPKIKTNEKIGPGSYYVPCSFGVVPVYENSTKSKFKNV